MVVILEARRSVLSHCVKCPLESGIIFGVEFVNGYICSLPSQPGPPLEVFAISVSGTIAI